METQVYSEYQKVHTRCSDVVDYGNFVEISVKKKAIIETADVVELSQVIKRHTPQVNFLLIKFNGTFGASKSTCDYYSKKRLDCDAEYHAIVISSFFGRIRARLALSLNNPKFKFKIFRNSKKAINWFKANSTSKERRPFIIPSVSIQS